MSAEQDDLIHACIAAEVFNAGTAMLWRRRAEAFEWAKPRLGEHHGERTPAELSAAWNRCHQAAEACRNRALLAEMGGAQWQDVPTPLAS